MPALPVGTAPMPNLEQKPAVDHDEDALKLEEQTTLRTFDPAFARRTERKVDLLLIPLLTLVYLCSSLDKSNLGNAKTLGMVNDIGGDPLGDKYALLNAFYFMSYAPFIVPLALLAKRTKMGKLLATCACFWGIAATCFAAVQNFGGAYACRFLIGLGEAGYAPLVQVYLSRFYTRRALGLRVAFWLAMAPIGGFFNGIIAYGVSFIRGSLESWRVLFLLEGGLTLLVAIVALIVLPEDVPTFKFLTAEEKDYIMYIRSMDYSLETHEINWKHARAAVWRWQQFLPSLQNCCHQVMGAALGAYLPTFTSENGFVGATAQIATLAPYGLSAVFMVLFAFLSDRFKNRGWPIQFGSLLSTMGFLIYLIVPPTNHAARFAALIFAEVGHYISVPLIITWCANNAGNESRRAVAVPFGISVAQGVSVGSGYLFPAKDGPKYTTGSAACVALSSLASVFAGIYQFLIWRENKRRDREEGGPPAEGFQPDTATYADEAPGYRYLP